jgi:hypothetical protein
MAQDGFGSGAEELRWSTTRPLCPNEQTLGPTVGFDSYKLIMTSNLAARRLKRRSQDDATVRSKPIVA